MGLALLCTGGVHVMTVVKAICDELSDDDRKIFEAQRTYFVPPDGVTDADLRKIAAASAVTKVEQKWKLVW
jgi:hypothetical protein